MTKAQMRQEAVGTIAGRNSVGIIQPACNNLDEYDITKAVHLRATPR
jgi:hypothetical protein